MHCCLYVLHVKMERILLLVVHFLLCSSVRCLDYTYVNAERGQNVTQCINGGIRHPCQTLGYVADYVSNHSTKSSFVVKIQDLQVRINRAINFIHATNLKLEGQPTELMCTCNSSNNESCGFKFEDSQGLVIKFLTFNGCRVENTVGNTSSRAAVVISNCRDFVLEDSKFIDSVEVGLTIFNTYGVVSINRSVFQGSGACANCSSSSGLNILFNSSSHGNYSIENCHFLKNQDQRAYQFDDISVGGGILLRFRGESLDNVILFDNVIFEQNIATWGGGMEIVFGDNATKNNVTIRSAKFINNRASKAGGGLEIGYIDSTSDPPITNRVYIESCLFISNFARYGGGVAIYSSPTTCAHKEDHKHDTLVFKSCTWENNEGDFSSTIDISPYTYNTLGRYYFPHPTFIDCLFTSNGTRPSRIQSDINQTLINVGAFAVYGFQVQFEGSVIFSNLSYTALHVTDGTVSFLRNTQALFQNNSGSQGGALALFGSSSLHVYPNSTLTFINNSAFGAGGAIYHATQNHHDLISSRTCFIQNCSTNHSDIKPSFIFKNNSAGPKNQAGQSIFAITFLPCYFEQFPHGFRFHSVLKALGRIANFCFDQPDHIALATTGYKFSNLSVPLEAIPGQGISIPLEMTDELNNSASTVYRVVPNKMCQTDRQYLIDRLVVNAPENTQCNLSLVSLGFRESLFELKLSIRRCPPGFHISDDSCVCSAYSRKYAYYGINTCHDRQSNAYLSNGYWAGYDNDNESLLTAPCPSSFCVTQKSGDQTGIELPNIWSPKKLENLICRPLRAGWLCGQCKPNHTTYYHSPTYRCGPQHLCTLGILFYFLSEVFPIVFMFSVIALFDIRFTTGTASCLVFFAQVTDTMTLSLKWTSELPKSIEILSVGYKIIYGLFNFDFFNLEPASFCLWKTATVLDVIAFKYVSVVFAFALLLSIVLFLKHCTCNRLQNGRNILPVGRNISVIHSMSAVLVMCYAQCTNISLQILATSMLRGAGGIPKHEVTLFGGNYYFQGEHLLYAVAACFCLSTVVAIPPILLLVYPGYLSIFSFFKLNETHLARLMSRVFIKIKPFLDSFQGCYQDKLRLFSALFFVTRVAILAINSFVTSTSQSILMMEIVILILFGMYALSHPFRRAADNINTLLILLNMSIIVALTMLAYSQRGYDDQKNVVLFAIIARLIFLYLPIVCICGYITRRVLSWYIQRLKKKRENEMSNSIVSEEEQSSRVIDHSYLPYQEVTIDSAIPAPEKAELSDSCSDREDLLGFI